VRNDTEAQLWVTWHPIDPWRGYYELHASGYSCILSDAILAWHESEAMLKELNGRLMCESGEADVSYVRAFLRTSNVFSTGLDFRVRDEPLLNGIAQPDGVEALGGVGGHVNRDLHRL
jgi:hypothetical protein